MFALITQKKKNLFLFSIKKKKVKPNVDVIPGDPGMQSHQIMDITP